MRLNVMGLVLFVALTMAVSILEGGDLGASSPRVALHSARFFGPKARLAPTLYDSCWDFGNPNAQGVSCSAYAVDNQPLLAAPSIYLVAVQPDSLAGVAGVAVGVAHEPGTVSTTGIQVFAWTLCGDAETASADWPGSGSSNTNTWDPDTNCQRMFIGDEGVHAVAGHFYVYVYSDAIFEVTHPAEGAYDKVTVMNCLGGEIHPEVGLPVVGYGDRLGYNPCLEDVPVRLTSWGRIKTVFR